MIAYLKAKQMNVSMLWILRLKTQKPMFRFDETKESAQKIVKYVLATACKDKRYAFLHTKSQYGMLRLYS